MIKFKGPHSAKQYLPKKTIKRGYKIWALADKYGYLWNFELYTEKSGDLNEKNLGARVIKQLSHPCKIRTIICILTIILLVTHL